MPPMTSDSKPLLNRSTRYYIIWTVAFGVILAFGGSALEPFPIPLLGVTAASPLVALMVTLNKIVIRRRLSVMWMYAVVSIIAIFTSYLGPPSLLKPIFILAGLSFDAGTFFRTKTIKLWNLLLGHLALTIVGFAGFYAIYAFHLPQSADAIRVAVIAALLPYYGLSVVIASLVYLALRPQSPPAYLRRLWDYFEPEDAAS